MKKSISDIIKEALLQRGTRSLRIDDTNFFLSLIDSPTKRKGARYQWNFKRILLFGMFISSIFACLVFMIYATTFFIRDILLFNEKPVVSEAGAIIPQRSCVREQVLFHFNAADCWANTGVQLQRGDRIKISHSGGFHSDIAEIYIKARSNGELKYPYYSNSAGYNPGGADRCIYNKVNRRDLTLWQRITRDTMERAASFGSILWQVANENDIWNAGPEEIHQIAEPDARNFIRIEQDGELFLAVNDILLNAATVGKLNFGSNHIWESVPDSIRNNSLWAREHDLDFVGTSENGKRKLLYSPGEVGAYLADNPQMRTLWFQDNVGSVLICIEVERHVRWPHWFTRWYRDTERRINWACDFQFPFNLVTVPAAGLWSVVRLWWLPLLLIGPPYFWSGIRTIYRRRFRRKRGPKA